jgi:hypothetical protein
VTTHASSFSQSETKKLTLSFPAGEFVGFYQWAVDFPGGLVWYLGSEVIRLTDPNEKERREADAGPISITGPKKKAKEITGETGLFLSFSRLALLVTCILFIALSQPSRCCIVCFASLSFSRLAYVPL